MIRIPLFMRNHLRIGFCRVSMFQAKINALRGLQSQSQEELDALLPSVLDRAFKGEL